MVDLCKPAYDSAIYLLNRDIAVKAKQVAEREVWYFYGTDGNTRITRDSYDSPLMPVKLADVLRALKRDAKKDSYRRFKWGVAMLEALEAEPEAEVILYGY